MRRRLLPIISAIIALLLTPEFLVSQGYHNVTSDFLIEHEVMDAHRTNFGSGVSFLDIDLDGFDDLIITNGPGIPFSVYINEAGLGFTEADLLLDGIEHLDSEMVSWADYDNDGDLDLFVSYSLGNNKLYQNQGDLSFVDVSAVAGIDGDSPHSSGQIWADFDNDGLLDIFVSSQLQTSANEGQNFLYRNLGDGSFSEMAATSGVAEARIALTTSAIDYNNDGRLDIYIANDKALGNQLFRNDGNMQFSDVSSESGSGIKIDNMGIAVADYDNDGFFDLYLTNSPPGNVLLRNRGDGSFEDVTDSQKVGVYLLCWGALFLDFNLDGWEDLHVSVSGEDYDGNGETRNHMLRNLNDSPLLKSFVSQPQLEPTTNPVRTWGSAIGDFNNDGLIDIAEFNNASNFALWQSQIDNVGHWIKFKVEGTRSNRDGIGALVTVYSNDHIQRRQITASTSYRSQSSYTQTLGLGGTTVIDSVQVKWPSGVLDTWYDLESETLHNLVEATTDTEGTKEIPMATELSISSFPNPFSNGVDIDLELNNESKVSLVIVDLLGRNIRTLEVLSSRVHWDGKDDLGLEVLSGHYVALLSQGRQVVRHIMTKK